MSDRYQTAATMYLVYGIVYWLGGFYLWLHGVGRGSTASIVWILFGAALVVLVPFLLRRRRPWFERWILSRRDFARLVAIFLVLRIVAVLRVVVRGDGSAVATPWGGEIGYRVGGAVFVAVAALAAFLLARAAWAAEPSP